MRPHLSTEVAVEGGRSAAGGSGAQLLPSHSFFHLSDPPARRRSLCRHFKTLSSPSLLPPWLPTSASEAPGAHSSRRASRRVTRFVPTHAALLPARAGPAPRSHSAMPAPLLPAPAVPRMAAILSACPEPPACCLWLPPRCRGGRVSPENSSAPRPPVAGCRAAFVLLSSPASGAPPARSAL